MDKFFVGVAGVCVGLLGGFVLCFILLDGAVSYRDFDTLGESVKQIRKEVNAIHSYHQQKDRGYGVPGAVGAAEEK